MPPGTSVEIQGQGSRKARAASKVNAGIGGANKVALAAASTPYLTATVHAVKPGATDDANTGDNTGIVRITAGENSESTPLSQGQSMVLSEFCDLADYYLTVDTAADGVTIEYTTEASARA